MGPGMAGMNAAMAGGMPIANMGMSGFNMADIFRMAGYGDGVPEIPRIDGGGTTFNMNGTTFGLNQGGGFKQFQPPQQPQQQQPQQPAQPAASPPGPYIPAEERNLPFERSRRSYIKNSLEETNGKDASATRARTSALKKRWRE